MNFIPIAFSVRNLRYSKARREFSWPASCSTISKATAPGVYRHAMIELGISEEAVDGILQRSKLYEAALLFKIATRSVNRFNSP